MDVAKRWQQHPAVGIVAECGTGKTLMSLGAIHVHSAGRPYTAIVMVPPHLVEKWAREAIQTLPGIRVFMVDDLRNGGDPRVPHGINEVRMQGGRVVRKGLHAALTDIRLRKSYPSPRKRWSAICPGSALFIVGRERAKLGYFWRHAFSIPRCGPYSGCAVNPETGAPVIFNEERLLSSDSKTPGFPS